MTTKMKRLSRALMLAFALTSAPATYAFSPFVVTDIRVEGIQRIEPGTVFLQLPVKVGEKFSEKSATESIENLYKTGYFRDVRVEVDGTVVVVVVEERPAIAAIKFRGMKEFDSKLVLASLKEVGFSEAKIYDKALLDKAVVELKRQYASRGKYAVEITPTVTPLERNRVDIVFDVTEGQRTTIEEMRIIGTKAFSESEILDMLQSTGPGWMTWYTKSDQYAKAKVQADIETIRSFYLNNGFLDFDIEQPQVTISPDLEKLFITITVREGNPYTIKDIKLAGNLMGLDKEISELIQLETGVVYSAKNANAAVARIKDYLGSLGYAFADVTVRPELDKENSLVSLTIYINPNQRVYVRRVNIGGNTQTRDVVIRREVRQLEGAWFNSNTIRLSRNRIERLGYFQEVKIDTVPVPDTPDQVDVNITVVERSTGLISLSVGYNTTDSVVFAANLSQDNIFGSGTNASIEFNTSKTNRTIALSQTDPYFTDDGISRTIDVFYRTIEPAASNDGFYRNKVGGGGLRFGVPFTEVDRVFFGISAEYNRLETDVTSPTVYKTFVDQYGASNSAYIASVSWARDSRDSSIAPREGGLSRISTEGSFAGDLQYYKFTLQQQYFYPVTSFITLAANGQFDYGSGYGGKPFPVIKNFYAGGLGTVRGYEGASLGPRDDKGGSNDSVGGAKRFFANLELIMPFPGTQQDRSLRWFVFLDGGNVFAEGAKMDFSELRYSAGIGLSWESPIGPLKLSLANPLNAKDNDKKERFQFQIGTGF